MLSVFLHQSGGFQNENTACLTLKAKTLWTHEAKITRNTLLVACTLCLTETSHGFIKKIKLNKLGVTRSKIPQVPAMFHSC